MRHPAAQGASAVDHPGPSAPVQVHGSAVGFLQAHIVPVHAHEPPRWCVAKHQHTGGRMTPMGTTTMNTHHVVVPLRLLLLLLVRFCAKTPAAFVPLQGAVVCPAGTAAPDASSQHVQRPHGPLQALWMCVAGMMGFMHTCCSCLHTCRLLRSSLLVQCIHLLLLCLKLCPEVCSAHGSMMSSAQMQPPLKPLTVGHALHVALVSGRLAVPAAAAVHPVLLSS